MDFWTLFTRKLDRARALSRPDRRLLLHAWVLLLVVDVGLRCLPFRLVQSLLRGSRDAVRRDDIDVPALIAHLNRFVDLAARNHFYAMSCLRQSLVLQRLLARRGISADLRFGVHKEAAGLAAHAWLEYHGEPIAQRPSTVARFVALKAGR